MQVNYTMGSLVSRGLMCILNIINFFLNMDAIG